MEPLDNTKATGFSTIVSDDLQSEFNSIKDSYSSKRIPSDLKLNANRAGIKARESAYILANCARYTETTIKILGKIQANSVKPTYSVNDQLQELVVVNVAMMHYIQEEYCGLVVVGSFGEKTPDIFRSLTKHTSSFTPNMIEHVKSVPF